MVRGLSRIGHIGAEHGFVRGDVEGVAGPAAAKEKILAIRSDKDHPANNPRDAKHREAVQELRGLYQLAYGTEVVAEMGG